jgi:HAD superfamily hydrolase (TIGR01549 family)
VSDDTPDQRARGVLLDLDGTLVDSVYQHVVAWSEALAEAGHDVPQRRIHRAIGMGSDRLVPWLLGGHVDDADAISDDHKRRFLARTDTLRATTGARELLDDLERRGVPFVIATSASGEEREALFEVLGRHDLPAIDSDAVSSSKPAADLLLTACDELGVAPGDATMIGDAPWDALAAVRVGIGCIGVGCGGFDDRELLDAGATRVVPDPRDLIGQL